MKLKIRHPFVFLALLMILAGGYNLAAAQSPDGPEIFFSRTAYDFGEVCEGDDVRHHFMIQNKGELPLKIIDVKTD